MNENKAEANKEIKADVHSAYVNPLNLSKNPLAALFMPVWYFRWIALVLVATIWWNYPRTCYLIFFIIDLIPLTFSVLALGGLWSPLGILYLVEEAFVLIWHVSQFILWVDFYKGEFPGDGKMSDGATKFWSWLILISIWICLLLELAGFIIGLFVGGGGSVGGGKKENLESEEMQLEIAESGTELNNKIITYNTMKAKAGEGENGKNE